MFNYRIHCIGSSYLFPCNAPALGDFVIWDYGAKLFNFQHLISEFNREQSLKISQIPFNWYYPTPPLPPLLHIFKGCIRKAANKKVLFLMAGS